MFILQDDSIHVLHPQPVLETLKALWTYDAASFSDHKHVTIECKAGNLARVLKHPNIPPPPPPCQLDGVEYELETATIMHSVTDECNIMEPKECALILPISQNELHKYGHKEHSYVNTPNKYPFPDLVPEAFDNIQMSNGRNLLDYNLQFQRSRDDTTSINTWFLITLLICSLLLVYLLPSQNS